MSKFEKVKKYHNSGLWNRRMVENAVVKGWITEQEAAEILTPEKVAETEALRSATVEQHSRNEEEET